MREDGDERRAVATDEAVEVVRRHARRQAVADDGEDAVDKGFGRNVHRAARRVEVCGQPDARDGVGRGGSVPTGRGLSNSAQQPSCKACVQHHRRKSCRVHKFDVRVFRVSNIAGVVDEERAGVGRKP